VLEISGSNTERNFLFLWYRRRRKRKGEAGEAEKDENKNLRGRQLRAKDVAEVFEKSSRPFLTIIFLTSRAGRSERRCENGANVGTRWWLRRFHKGERKTQDVA
jgi:hypothetical protein